MHPAAWVGCLPKLQMSLSLRLLIICAFYAICYADKVHLQSKCYPGWRQLNSSGYNWKPIDLMPSIDFYLNNDI